MCPKWATMSNQLDMLDKRTLEQLFRRHYGAMLRLAETLMHDDEEAKDLVHDVFLRLMNSRPPQPDNEAAYLMTAVRNSCLNRIRQMQLREQVRHLLPVETEPLLQPIEKRLEQTDETQTFPDQQLEEPHRSIFHLRFDEDLTIAEIAQRLDMNPNTTYKYLIQCIQQIRHHFKR